MRHAVVVFGAMAVLVAGCSAVPPHPEIPGVAEGYALWVAGAGEGAGSVDLSASVIVASPTNPVHGKVAGMLQEEIQKRTGIQLARADALPASDVPAVVLGSVDAMPTGAEKTPVRSAATVYLAGRDDRGVLYAAGRLLRSMAMRKGELTLAPDVAFSTAPQFPLRGHELGYRHTANTYDAWDMAQYEQHIRDLAVFGDNLIQLIYDHSKPGIDGPHMTEPALERCAKIAKVCESYGLDVWVWMPVGEDLTNESEAAAALDARRAFFEKVSPISTVFVPGGDPGHTEPKVLLPWLEKLAGVLHETHPEAEVWLSNEEFGAEWNDQFFEALAEEPKWLGGLVFGTWTKLTIAEERERTPERYPISCYSDITHSIECQYPVPAWDAAFANTLGREGINPRPEGMALIFRKLAQHSVGFNAYSDGVHDDVNKIVWNALGWDLDADVRDVLREYGRYFIGEDYGDTIADGLLALERNWRGALENNRRIEETLAHWQSMEQEADAAVLGNWRFEMGLYRAYYDAYLQRKLKHEEVLERTALASLKRAGQTGVEQAIEAAREQLARAASEPQAQDLRERIEALGAGLFESIGMQLSVEPPYYAKNWERGATLDGLDRPLNNRDWLEKEFDAVLAVSDEARRLELLDAVVNWEDPGPGGFYDDLGNAEKQPHLVRQKTWEEDPGYVESPQEEHIEFKGREWWRQSWRDQGQTLYYTPLKMRYEGLDAAAQYALEVVYTGRFRPTMRLVADETYEIHDFMAQPPQPERLRFEIPKEATADGVLELAWERNTGRGCQVGEVWLKKVAE